MRLKSSRCRTNPIAAWLLWASPVMPVVVMLLAVDFASMVAAQEKKVSVLSSELPAIIRKAVEQAFPNGEILRIEREVAGEDPGQYDVELRSEGKEYEVEISPQGKIIESKQLPSETEAARGEPKKWTETFREEDCTFSTTGKNRFFVLEPGYQLVLENRNEKVVITVLDETRKIGGVVTRVVEEREEENGELKEVSRNFSAICQQHGDVFYFGEEVDDYQEGQVVAHSGAWRADDGHSKPGILMPGTVLLGARHYQEIAPNAQDRAEIIRDDVTMKTPAGTFQHCIQVEETSGIDAKEKCYKTYAPGVGLIQDEDLVLTSYHRANRYHGLEVGSGGCLTPLDRIRQTLDAPVLFGSKPNTYRAGCVRASTVADGTW